MTREQRTIWRSNMIVEVIKRALTFKTCKEWKESDNSKDFTRSRVWGIYKQCTAHMPGHLRWSIKQPDTTIQIAKRYSTRGAWKKGHRNSYNYARRRPELFAECVSHMPVRVNCPFKVKDLKTGKIYDTVRAAAKATKIPFQRVAQVAGGHVSKKYGKRFSYVLNY